jgi:hypothetical protein
MLSFLMKKHQRLLWSLTYFPGFCSELGPGEQRELGP